MVGRKHAQNKEQFVHSKPVAIVTEKNNHTLRSA